MFIFAVSAITVTAQSFAMTKNGQDDPYGISSAIPKIIEAIPHLGSAKTSNEPTYSITGNNTPLNNTTDSYLSSRVATMESAYFKWFFPHWIITIPFAAILFLLYKYKEYKILALYFSTMLFFIISTIANQFGFRSAILLWPMTYLIYAFGTYYLILTIWKLTDKYSLSFRAFSVSLVIIGFITFGIFNMLYAITMNTNLNVRNDYALDRGFERYLLENTLPGETIYIPRILRQYIFGSEIFFKNKIIPPQENPQYLVLIEQNDCRENQINYGTRGLINAMLSFTDRPALPPLQSQKTKEGNPPIGYALEKSFADISIYRYEGI
jgi:hypothetical protein